MSSQRSSAATQAAKQSGDISREFTGIGLLGLRDQFAQINQGLAGQNAQQQALAPAFAGQRTGLLEGLISGQGQQTRGALRAGEAARGGGNIGAALTPSEIGAQIADSMYASKVQEGMANVEQFNKFLGMGFGAVGPAGNAAVEAASNRLTGISGMPNYNPTYATVLGLANVAGTGYGAYQQWASQSPLIQPLPMGQSFSGVPGTPLPMGRSFTGVGG